MMLRSTRLVAGLALAALGFSACSDSTSPNATAFVGVYALSSLNGTTPPVVVAEDAVNGRLEVTGGTITLNSDMTFSDRTDFRITDPNGAISTDFDLASGTYTTSGNTVTLTPTGDAPYSLVLNGSTLTQTAGTFTFVYSK